jgi:hypothetical protein
VHRFFGLAGGLVLLLGVDEGGDCAHASAPEDELADVLLAVEVAYNGVCLV